MRMFWIKGMGKKQMKEEKEEKKKELYRATSAAFAFAPASAAAQQRCELYRTSGRVYKRKFGDKEPKNAIDS